LRCIDNMLFLPLDSMLCTNIVNLKRECDEKDLNLNS